MWEGISLKDFQNNIYRNFHSESDMNLSMVQKTLIWRASSVLSIRQGKLEITIQHFLWKICMWSF